MRHYATAGQSFTMRRPVESVGVGADVGYCQYAASKVGVQPALEHSEQGELETTSCRAARIEPADEMMPASPAIRRHDDASESKEATRARNLLCFASLQLLHVDATAMPYWPIVLSRQYESMARGRINATHGISTLQPADGGDDEPLSGQVCKVGRSWMDGGCHCHWRGPGEVDSRRVPEDVVPAESFRQRVFLARVSFWRTVTADRPYVHVSTRSTTT